MASDRRSAMGSNLDDPPNSRLFIIGSKLLSEDDFRNAFSEFGHIEEIWVVKDRHNGENKGVTYIKYSKTSDAARALEGMNEKCIGNLNRNIKVMVAASPDQGSKRESNEEEKLLRLFVLVPKTMTDSELYNSFKLFGEIDYANIIRDRDTKESKGFAYIKYFKFSHAAAAFEQCDRKYRAVFAEPRKTVNTRNEENKSFNDSSFNNKSISINNLPLPTVSSNNNSDSYTKLTAIVSPQINQDQLWKLFDIVPGLDYCQLRFEGRPRPARGIASIVYTHPQWAAHAKDKLHGFEYPPGNRLIVKPDYDTSQNLCGKSSTTDWISTKPECNRPDIRQIAETIAQASTLIQAAGISSDLLQVKFERKEPVLCNVELPDPQPFASIDSETEARCFIVCSPNPPPNLILRDVFSRFGDLIDVYMLTNRNCGYAKYASKEAADQAIRTLHGAEICGIRIKVLEAEERPDYNNRKRQRLDERSC